MIEIRQYFGSCKRVCPDSSAANRGERYDKVLFFHYFTITMPLQNTSLHISTAAGLTIPTVDREF
jgi:hypothetical protein